MGRDEYRFLLPMPSLDIDLSPSSATMYHERLPGPSRRPTSVIRVMFRRWTFRNPANGLPAAHPSVGPSHPGCRPTRPTGRLVCSPVAISSSTSTSTTVRTGRGDGDRRMPGDRAGQAARLTALPSGRRVSSRSCYRSTRSIVSRVSSALLPYSSNSSGVRREDGPEMLKHARATPVRSRRATATAEIPSCSSSSVVA